MTITKKPRLLRHPQLLHRHSRPLLRHSERRATVLSEESPSSSCLFPFRTLDTLAHFSSLRTPVYPRSYLFSTSVSMVFMRHAPEHASQPFATMTYKGNHQNGQQTYVLISPLRGSILLFLLLFLSSSFIVIFSSAFILYRSGFCVFRSLCQKCTLSVTSVTRNPLSPEQLFVLAFFQLETRNPEPRNPAPCAASAATSHALLDFSLPIRLNDT